MTRHLITTAALVAVLAARASHAGEAAQPAPMPAPEPSAGAPAARAPGTESGFFLFQARCTSCHGNPQVERAPSPEALRAMPPERIYAALGPGGIMAESGAVLSDAERRRIAEFMAGRPMGSAESGGSADDGIPVPHESAAGRIPSRSRVERLEPRPREHALPARERRRHSPSAQVPQLKLKWAFGFPSGVSSANAQPTVASGPRVRRQRQRLSSTRSTRRPAASTGRLRPARSSATRSTVGAVTGGTATRSTPRFRRRPRERIRDSTRRPAALLWKTKVDPHFVARITAGTRYYDGKLIVPVSSSEEFSSGNPGYSCCTSRGCVVALDASTGKQIWKAWVVARRAEALQDDGERRHAVCAGRRRGVEFADDRSGASRRLFRHRRRHDRAVAEDDRRDHGRRSRHGQIPLVVQATENDVLHGRLQRRERQRGVSEADGPGHGHRQLADPDQTFRTASACCLARSPPTSSRSIRTTTASCSIASIRPAPSRAGIYHVGAPAILWGGATDGHRAYYGLGTGGVAALDAASGRALWRFLPTLADGSGTDSLGAAPTVLPGVVFEGSGHGMLYALAASDGHVLWQFDTARSFDTVNGVAAHGGAIAVSGAVAVGGMLYVGSGYAIGNGATAGNLLLAFGL